MAAFTIFLPLLTGRFGWMAAAGIAIYALSARARSDQLARRCQALAFVVFSLGSAMIVQGIALAYQR